MEYVLYSFMELTRVPPAGMLPAMRACTSDARACFRLVASCCYVRHVCARLVCIVTCNVLYVARYTLAV